jgi:hypothetical protein
MNGMMPTGGGARRQEWAKNQDFWSGLNLGIACCDCRSDAKDPMRERKVLSVIETEQRNTPPPEPMFRSNVQGKRNTGDFKHAKNPTTFVHTRISSS